MECAFSLKSLSRPRIRVLCRWSCGQCCVRGSVFLLSRSTWPQTRQAQTSSLHQVLGWHVSQWWQVIADFTNEAFAFSCRVHNSRSPVKMHTVFAAGNWTERNAAMTQEQHVDQGEMVVGRAATLGHRKITVRRHSRNRACHCIVGQSCRQRECSHLVRGRP